MVVSIFFVLNKDGRERFFKESFLLANVKPNVVLGMPFLTISNIDIDFQARDVQWRSYTTGKIILTTRQVELIGNKEFAVAALDLEHEAFIVHIAALSVDLGDGVHPSKKAQIAHLKVDKVPFKGPSEYADFAEVYTLKLAIELLEHMEINDYTIELVDNLQPLYNPISSLGPMELETLKAYNENNLANGFIRLSKSPSGAPILFDKKSDGSLRLCVDYRRFNNLIIKNWYFLPLVGELLDWLGWAQRFTQLDLTNTYHWIVIKEGDEWKIAFRTCYSYFKYQVMSFELTNVPATFQSYINKILVKKLDIFMIVYLNDILIYIKSKSKEYMEAIW